MADIFISYARERKPLVRHLAQALECLGLSVWWDYEIRAGEKFSQLIEKEIRASKSTLVLWCSLSVESDWVQGEAGIAKKAGVYTPAGLEFVEVPIPFRGDHTRDLSSWDCSLEHDSFRQLLKDIETKVGRPLPETNASKQLQISWANLGRTFFPPLQPQAPSSDASRKEQEQPTKATGAAGQAEHTGAASSPGAEQIFNAKLAAFPLDLKAARAAANQEIGSRLHKGEFGLLNLHPAIREAVVDAIRSAHLAREHARRARLVAQAAHEVEFRLLEKGGPTEDNEEYSMTGEVQNGTGLAVLSFKQDKFEKHRYAGLSQDGAMIGPGVYYWPEPGEAPDASETSIRLAEGEHPADGHFGYVVKTWRNGGIYMGRVQGDDARGHGVSVNSSGFTFEGEWNRQLEGYAATWRSDGTLAKSGLWKNGTLIAAIPPEKTPPP